MIVKNIIVFEIKDLIKSKWFFVYSSVVFTFNFMIIYFSAGKTNEILATLTNFFLLVVPLYTMIFSIINLYESIHFQNLLIIRGIHRSLIFLGKFLGLFSGLFLSFILGCIPFFIFYPKLEDFFYIFFLLIFYSFLLHLIFLGIAFLISQFKFRLEVSIGLSILLWFFSYIIYDSIIFLIAVNFGDYPLESIIIAMLFINPIDLIRTVLFIHGDLSIIMSYSSALYLHIFGSKLGILTGILFLLFVSLLLFFSGQRKFLKRDI